MEIIIVVVLLGVVFRTIPRKDWKAVALYMIMSGGAFILCSLVFPNPFHIMAFVWLVIGQGVLAKKKIFLQYPTTLQGSILTFGMAMIWPKYYFKKPETE